MLSGFSVYTPYYYLTLLLPVDLLSLTLLTLLIYICCKYIFILFPLT